MGFDFPATTNFFHCLGARLTINTIGANYQTLDVTPAEFFSGFITDVKVYSTTQADETWFGNSFSECGGCLGTCGICQVTDTQCPYEKATTPKTDNYDFTESGASWVGTHSTTVGAGTDFVIAEDWFVATPYL